MQISPVAEKLIEIDRQTKQTAADIATAVAVKQRDAEKQQGNAALQLIQQAVVASPNATQRGVDIRA
jgi:hypothetical protein